MALPADHRGGPRDQHQVADRDVREQHERAHQQHEDDHAGEHRQLAAQRRHAVARFHQRDQLADEERDHRIERRHRQAGGEHRRVPPLGLAHEVPVEAEQARRRRIRPGPERLVS